MNPATNRTLQTAGESAETQKYYLMFELCFRQLVSTAQRVVSNGIILSSHSESCQLGSFACCGLGQVIQVVTLSALKRKHTSSLRCWPRETPYVVI